MFGCLVFVHDHNLPKSKFREQSRPCVLKRYLFGKKERSLYDYQANQAKKFLISRDAIFYENTCPYMSGLGEFDEQLDKISTTNFHEKYDSGEIMSISGRPFKRGSQVAPASAHNPMLQAHTQISATSLELDTLDMPAQISTGTLDSLAQAGPPSPRPSLGLPPFNVQPGRASLRPNTMPPLDQSVAPPDVGLEGTTSLDAIMDPVQLAHANLVPKGEIPHLQCPHQTAQCPGGGCKSS